MFKLCTSLFTALVLFFFISVSYAQDFSIDPKGQGPGGNPSNLEGEIEINYDGPNSSGVGAADADFIIAARFTTTQTGAVVGEYIKKVRVFIYNPTVGNTATVRIYSAGTPTTPGAEIYSQAFSTNPAGLEWHEVVLNTPVQVPNADIWVGVQALAGPAGVQFWGGTDAGPNHPDGQFIFFNGSWATLVALNPALTFNWNIRAVVDEIVPVELTSFTASVVDGHVNLNWQTATESNNYGFEVQRANSDKNFLTVGFVNGFGTTTETQNYTYSDKNLNNGSYTYRLKQVDYDGQFEYSNEIEVDIESVPADYTLNQNFPNPFNPSTRISFTLPVESNVTIKLFNVIGEELNNLAKGSFGAGVHNIDFNALGLNSGVYFYSIEAVGIDGNTFSEVKKMMFTK